MRQDEAKKDESVAVRVKTPIAFGIGKNQLHHFQTNGENPAMWWQVYLPRSILFFEQCASVNSC
jgi:hypothetical protein